MSDRFCRHAVCRATAAIFAVHLLLVAPVAAQAPDGRTTLTPAQYAAEIGRLADVLRGAEPDDISRVLRTLPPVWTVDANGTTVEVPGVWIQRRLQEGQKDPERWPALRAQLLEALAASGHEARGMPGRTETRRDVRGVLDEVLARPEFRQIARDTAMARWQARLIDWLRRWWSRVGGDSLPVRSAATIFAWVATLAALAVLVGWLMHSLRRSATVHVGADPSLSPRTSADAWARRAVAADDLREAARCAYRAVISRLEEDGTWRTDDARTPREYVRLLPRDHVRRPAFQDVARRFEEIWFGARQPTADDRGSFVRGLRELGCLPAD